MVTFIGSLKPYITASPAIGVAVPGALLINPAMAMITPAAAPPMKLVTSTGIGYAESITACVSGSTVTEIVVIMKPYFIRRKKTQFITDETNQSIAPNSTRQP